MKRVPFERTRRAKHKRDQGVSKMGVSGGAHGLANGPHLAMKKTGISRFHRFERRQYVAPAQGGVIRAPDGPSDVVLLEGVEKVILFILFF